jgi:dethiobiotin synthetase
MARELFVTGTDTGVGKTLVTAALLRLLRERGLRVRGLKPVASGAAPTPGGLRNDDALLLQAESSPPVDYDTVNPYCFAPACAPHLAAAEQNTELTGRGADGVVPARVRFSATQVLVEGAGGWRVPLHPTGFLSDLPEALELPVLLVVGLRLGCLNHARLTYEAIVTSGRCRFAGWVGNAVDAGFEHGAANVDTLARLLGAAPLALIPRLPDASVTAAAQAIESPTLLRQLLARG